MFVRKPEYVKYETQYNAAAKLIMNTGAKIEDDRTGVGTRMLPGISFKADLSKEVPILTTKFVGIKDVFKELKWLISGDTSEHSLAATGCSIWNEWAGALGQLGPIYPAMWRRRPVSKVNMVKVPRKDIHPNDSDKFKTSFFFKHEDVHYEECLAAFVEAHGSSNPEVSIYKHYLKFIKGLRGKHVMFQESWEDFEEFKKDFFKIPGCEFAINDVDGYCLTGLHLNAQHVGLGCVEFLHATQLSWLSKIESIEGSNSIIAPRFYVDQLGECIEAIKIKGDRRCIVDCWDPSLLPAGGVWPHEQHLHGLQSLACCHYAFQFHKTPPEAPGRLPRLSITVTQRSQDMALGNPYNMPSYAMLLMMVANVTDCEPWMLTLNVGDCHVYENHVTQLRRQVQRLPKLTPKLVIREGVKHDRLEDFTFEDFELTRYGKSLVTKYDVAV